MSGAMPVRDIGKSLFVLLIATLIGYIFYSLGFTEANIIAVYIFGVLITSIITTNRLCSLVTSFVSVLVFNFFFTIPRFTFHFYDPDYLVTFTIMFMVAILTGSLATKLKDNAKQSARAAFRTKILFETNQLFQKETDEQSILNATAEQLIKLLKRDLVIYPSEGKNLADPVIYRVGDGDTYDLNSENEKAVAAWVFRNNKHAGATTDTLANARCRYLAVRVNQQVYGVVGIAMNEVPLDSFENSVLLSILGECALALENVKNAKEKEEAAILAKNEQLRANLLRAISHDLRNAADIYFRSASNLLTNYEKMDDAIKVQTFTDIYDDSMADQSGENLLAVTRIEGGRVNLTKSVELIDEVITEASRHINRKSKEHIIRTSFSQDFLLAHMDAKLVVQVIINLVDNAIKYTPAGSNHRNLYGQKDQWIVVSSVADDGPGIPDDQKSRIFEMFYSGTNKIADSRRSLGLGLSFVQTIVTAHGGTISVSDNQPKGATFTFTLPAGRLS